MDKNLGRRCLCQRPYNRYSSLHQNSLIYYTIIIVCYGDSTRRRHVVANTGKAVRILLRPVEDVRRLLGLLRFAGLRFPLQHLLQRLGGRDEVLGNDNVLRRRRLRLQLVRLLLPEHDDQVQDVRSVLGLLWLVQRRRSLQQQKYELLQQRRHLLSANAGSVRRYTACRVMSACCNGNNRRICNSKALLVF